MNFSIQSALLLTPATLCAADPPLGDLVAHWQFDEGKGETANDSGPGGHHATIHGAEWVEGRDGQGFALRFDGESSWVECGKAEALNPAGEFTLEAWVKPEKSGRNMTIAAKGYRYNAPFNLRMGMPWDREVVRLESGAYATHNVKLPLDEWSQVAAVSDGQRVALFVNGELRSVRPGASLRANDIPMTIGKAIGAPDGGEFFKGVIDDVRLHGRALPQYPLSGPTASDVTRGTRQITTGGGWGSYEGFPDACLLKNNALLVSFFAGRGHMDWPEPDLPDRGRICVMQSDDFGKTWSEPRTIIDTATGERDPSLTQLKDGTVICSYFETIWYERGRVCEVRTIRSSDNGVTWEKQPSLVPSPWYTPSQKEEVIRLAGPPAKEASHEHPIKEEYAAINATTSPVLELSNGDLLLPIYGHFTGDDYRCGVARSTDGGATWSETHLIPESEHLTEPDLVELPDGRLLCVMRPEMATSYSTDQGRTWSPAKSGLLPRGAAPDLLLTRDGLLLCGIREQPASRTGVLISKDLGASWSDPQILGFAGGAYPSLVELPDGRIFCAYYCESGGGNVFMAIFTIDRETLAIQLEPVRDL